MLEDEPDIPLLGMQRYYSGKAPYTGPEVAGVTNFLGAAPDRLVWSVTPADAPDGQRSAATSHGAFDNEERTLESLRHVLKTGLP